MVKSLYSEHRGLPFLKQGDPVTERVRDSVQRWMERFGHLSHYSSIAEMSEDIGVSEDQLKHYVHTHYGKRLLVWQKDLRIEEAKALLLAYPHYSVSVIGEMVGILDKSNFKKQFTETVGMSPRAWREHHAASGPNP
jgi:AraC-like DNA-binding protein